MIRSFLPLVLLAVPSAVAVAQYPAPYYQPQPRQTCPNGQCGVAQATGQAVRSAVAGAAYRFGDPIQPAQSGPVYGYWSPPIQQPWYQPVPMVMPMVMPGNCPGGVCPQQQWHPPGGRRTSPNDVLPDGFVGGR